MPILILFGGILILIFFIIKKISPFFGLLIASIITGLLLGLSMDELLASIQQGMGSTLGSVTLIIVLGAILGKWLEECGAAFRITRVLVAKFGVKKVQWAIMLTGFIVGIPLFYSAGFVILVPLVFAIGAETGLSILFLAIPMVASLSVTHGLLPPHPSPVALASLFKANTGKVILYGLLISVPIAVIAGPLFARFFRKIKVTPPEGLFSTSPESRDNPLSGFYSFFTALLPIGIILLCVGLSYLFPSEKLRPYFNFFGDPVIAFILSLFFIMLILKKEKGYTTGQFMKWSSEAVESVAMIVLIIASGGVFKQVLIDGGVGDYIKEISSGLAFSPLILGWMIAAMLRLSIGSATVAGITAAGIVAPFLTDGVSPELMVLSVGSGSLIFSHVNDTGFWMFKEYFNLSMKQTILSWSVLETIVAVAGLLGVLALNLVIN